MPLDMTKLRAYVALDAERLELQRKIKEIKAELDPMELALLDQFAADQVTSVKVDGRLAYLRSELWAGAKDGNYDRACRALVRYGLKDMVRRRFDTQTLSAYVREAAENKEELAPGLLKAISVTEKLELRTKKA